MKSCFKVLLLLLPLVVTYGVLAQSPLATLKKEISKVHSTNEATAYLTTSQRKGNILSFDPTDDSSSLARMVYKSKPGTVLTFTSADNPKPFLIKILEQEKTTQLRVKYIFLDNAKLTKKAVDSISSIIFSRLSRGEAFESLAMEYSMDGNSAKGGDLGWVDQVSLMKEFVEPMKDKKIGETFSVDIPSKRWYYIVKKAYGPRSFSRVRTLYLEVAK